MRTRQASALGAIYLGGVLGALLRVGLAETFPTTAGSWPWATFGANLTGAFLLGFVSVRFGRNENAGRLVYPLLSAGFCGSLTTFSTFQFELLRMVESGQTGLAATYLVASLTMGYVAARVGMNVTGPRVTR